MTSGRGRYTDLAALAGPGAHQVLARLRAHEPVSRIPELRGVLVTSYELALAVLRDADTFTVDHPGFSTARVVGASMLSTDGAAHARHRRPFGHAFRAGAVTERFHRRVSMLAADLVDRIRPRGRADLRRELAGPLSTAVVAEALGLRDVDPATVLGWYAAIVAAVTDLSAGRSPSTDAAEAMAELDAAVLTVAEPDALLGAARRVLADGEVTSNAAVLMFGGIETTEAMIANTLVHVLTHPEVHHLIDSDRKMIPRVVEESLRLEPAAAVVDRYATRDIALAGTQIAAGELVRVSLAAANRDPSVFTEPDRFDPARDGLDLHLAFARGPHACLAMDLARLETRIALEAVLDGLAGVVLAAPTQASGLVFRKPSTLEVRWQV